MSLVMTANRKKTATASAKAIFAEGLDPVIIGVSLAFPHFYPDY